MMLQQHDIFLFPCILYILKILYKFICSRITLYILYVRNNMLYIYIPYYHEVGNIICYLNISFTK